MKTFQKFIKYLATMSDNHALYLSFIFQSAQAKQKNFTCGEAV